MSDCAIEVQDLEKVFTTRVGFWSGRTKRTLAVDRISFDIHKGELFGLLGPNGAGKTTTIKMLSTILLPTSGRATILGFDVVKQTQSVRERIGFTFGGTRGLYGRLSAEDNLKYFADLYGLEPATTHRRIPELLELVGLAERSKERVETYSSGMQQRLHLARALLHDPEVLFLDEPTVGIDPVGARELRETIKGLIGRGKTVVLTTHYMAEAEQLCDRIAIINKGRLVALDTPRALKKHISGETMLEIEIKRECWPALKAQLAGLGDGTTMAVTESDLTEKLTLRTSRPERALDLLTPFLSSKDVLSLEVRGQTLEDVYVAIIKGEPA